MDAVLQVNHLSKSFGSHEVLRDIDFTVKKGDVTSIIGASGSGKSTLLRCINLLETPSKGEIFFHGENVAARGVNPTAYRSKVGMVFQNFNLFSNMTVLQNCMVGQTKVLKRQEKDAKETALQFLHKVGMTPYINAKPRQLSGGQKQRVAIARALVGNGDIIVMDEPITNLDAKLREQMLEEIREIQRKSGTTVLYITHDQQSALQLCDRMAIMEPDGSLCQLGTDEDIILHPANRFTFEFIGVSNFIPVEVAGGAITLRPGQKDFPWADGKLPEGTDTSKKLELGVRPNDIVFDKDSSLRVTVKRSVFLGSEYDYFVELGGRELRIQQNTLDAAKYGVMREGQETGIRLLNYRFYPEKEVSA